jgi:hypothetical protein
MAAQWPRVVARLVALLPTLSGWDQVTVYDGQPVTEAKPTKYATVGYVHGNDHAGTYSTTQAGDGFRYAETGQVIGQLVCATGSVDLPGMRVTAFGLLDQIDLAIRADRTLGVLSPEGTTDLSVDPLPASNKQGTALALVFTLTYYTVT